MCVLNGSDQNACWCSPNIFFAHLMFPKASPSEWAVCACPWLIFLSRQHPSLLPLPKSFLCQEDDSELGLSEHGQVWLLWDHLSWPLVRCPRERGESAPAVKPAVLSGGARLAGYFFKKKRKRKGHPLGKVAGILEFQSAYSQKLYKLLWGLITGIVSSTPVFRKKV